MRSMIKSRKRIVQLTTTTASFGTTNNETITFAVQEPDNTNPKECNVGVVIQAIYVEIWAMCAAAQPGAANLTLEKRVSGLPNMSHTSALALDGYGNKNNIFKIHQGLIPDANSNPIPVLREWIMIPKGKQRMSLNDAWVLNVAAIIDDVEYCGFFQFKTKE